MMNNAETWDHLAHTAAHEAGHVVAARTLGGRAKVAFNPDTRDAHTTITGLSPAALLIATIAGATAERILLGDGKESETDRAVIDRAALEALEEERGAQAYENHLRETTFRARVDAKVILRQNRRLLISTSERLYRRFKRETRRAKKAVTPC